MPLYVEGAGRMQKDHQINEKKKQEIYERGSEQ
jgi:hypothetical protein